MNADALKEAAELAGMRYNGEPDNEFVYGDLDDVNGCWWSMDPENPALPAYIASLLVAKVTRGQWRTLHNAYCNQFDGFPPPYMQATDEQRIRAAVAVLKETGE